MSVDLNLPRSKKACISCRQRKRKCDGETPCSYCTRNGHRCDYASSFRASKTSHRRRQTPHESSGAAGVESSEDASQLRLLEANSPAVFARQLALKINPESAPRLNYYAWNLGLDLNYEASVLSQSPAITEILDIGQMRELAVIYFEHVNPVYTILESEEVEQAIVDLWKEESFGDYTDPMLGGLAALGCLFDQKSKYLEGYLAQNARSILESSTSSPSPHINLIIGWLLRVIYLRATNSPQATWMASCTLMHMIETAKLHLEPSENSVLVQDAIPCQPDVRRRVYWVAQLFNSMVSLDCGRSPVELRGASSELPDRTWSEVQQQLCSIPCSLTHKFDYSSSEMETEIAQLCELQPVQSMLQLLQCSIGLCFFRRSRALGRTLSDESLRLILDLCKSNLQLVKRLIPDLCPWWHVINIPFQVVCVSLVVGTDQGLALLAEALDALKQVEAHYGTAMARESYEIACFLATQERQRRLREYEHIANALERHKLSASLLPLADVASGSASGMASPYAFNINSQAGFDGRWSLADYFLLDSMF